MSRRSTPGLTVLRLACLVPLLLAESAAASPEASPCRPAVTPGPVIIESATSVVAGAICAAGLGYLLSGFDDHSDGLWKAFGGSITGSVSYPLFCGLGAWLGGKIGNQGGGLLPAAVGALVATPVALGLAWVGNRAENTPGAPVGATPFYVAAALTPPAGAVIGYNVGLLRAARAQTPRIELPTLTLRTKQDFYEPHSPLADSGTASPLVDLRLVTLGI